MSNLRFRTEYRLKRGADFQRVYQRKRSAGDEWLVVYGCENELPYPRLGLSVSRKVGNAVVRNRWKRLIREAFRLSRASLPTGIDLIVIPRQGVEPALQPLQGSLRQLASRVARRLTKDKP